MKLESITYHFREFVMKEWRVVKSHIRMYRNVKSENRRITLICVHMAVMCRVAGYEKL